MENTIENKELDQWIDKYSKDTLEDSEQSINDAWDKAKEQHKEMLVSKERFYQAQKNNELDSYYNTGSNLDTKDQEKLIESKEMMMTENSYKQLQEDMKKHDTININPVPRPMTIYDEITRRSDQLSILLKGTCVSTEKLIHAFRMELYKNQKLQSCQKESLLQSLMRCGEMGLIPGNGIYLIPYNGIAQTQVSLQGWLTMLWRSGNVGNIIHNLHREGDEFSYSIDQGGTTVYHKPKLEMYGEILGAYAMVTLKNQHIQFKYCNRKEIEASKDASKTRDARSPWNTHFDQMAQIVPLRKLARTLAPSLGEWDAEDIIIHEKTPLPLEGSIE